MRRIISRGRSVVATGTDAVPTGEYDHRRRTVHWDGRALDFRRSALVEKGRLIASLRPGRDRQTNPVDVELDDEAQLEPGLLLFAAFVTGRLAHCERNDDGL
jgi:hypothetical protein